MLDIASFFQYYQIVRSWRVQIRRKGRYASETFLRREDARRWALEAEVQADRGETPSSSRVARVKTFGELIDLHMEDMAAVGKTPLQSKAATLDLLQREPGKCRISSLDRERLIRFGRERADQGAGPISWASISGRSS
ncbi:Integrase (fragment) [Methylocella tundrae]|uniref:Integrase n=1 Tax=Methylocella tundrae TaxID=227605 RepID=A0A8B6M7W9_METTU